MNKIYLDNNATTPVDGEVLSEMLPFFSEYFQNPSSSYETAYFVRQKIEDSRKKVSDLLGCEPSEIFFTSGGTESVNHAIIGSALFLSEKGKHIITSSIEHKAVLSSCSFLKKLGYSVTFLPVDRNCRVSPDDFRRAITKDTIIASVMTANNETGAIQPVEELAQIAAERKILFHTDAVQAIGKIHLDVKKTSFSMLSLSGHKIYAPKGIGALYKKKDVQIFPLIHGGSHERRQRAGTENVTGIIAFGKAAEIAKEKTESERKQTKALRDGLLAKILENIPDVIVNTPADYSLPNTLNVSFKFIEGESLMTFLELDNIEVSTGSACSSESLDPSHVLLAMGLDHVDAHGSVRFSAGRHNKTEEVDIVVKSLKKAVEKLRKMSPLSK
ncbi:aminotransferase class V-fold PLP-dependent enzyme [candidate division WOR-3 bacterium]|nr:aminotransferase class V-fold PLP-dependent enzyme [candidate division WOR-3 bacterium]